MKVYVCPIPGCGNYYGASGMPDLATAKNYGRRPWSSDTAPGERYVTSTRDECPDCRSRGQVVRRVLREVVIR